MILKLKPNSFFVFDLDDTLYPEIDYLKSAYKQIAKELEVTTGKNIYDKMLKLYHSKKNAFEWIIATYSPSNSNITKEYLLQLYRIHQPTISLSKETNNFFRTLNEKKIPAGLITDGRSI